MGIYARRSVPCVGISFGVDRIFTILSERSGKQSNLPTEREIDVYVVALGGKEFNGLLLERMEIVGELWKAGIRADFSAKVKPKLIQQFKASKGASLAVILGKDEMADNYVRLKSLRTDFEQLDEKNQGQLVARGNLVEEVKKLLQNS